MSAKYPSHNNNKITQTWARKAVASLALGCAFSGVLHLTALGHGSLEGSRILQVRLAGPTGGTPAAWNESYYTWNQNSNNFTNYASPGFSYSDHIANGSIHNAGINGAGTGLDFSGLNTPSANWQTTAVTAGNEFTLRFLATAPHDPSHFAVFFTKQGFDATTQSLGWGNLDYLGKWSTTSITNPVTTGSATNPVAGGTMTSYDWNIAIPTDREGFHSLVVVWQREDPAGEAFIASRDFQVTAVPEPGTLALAFFSGIGLLSLARKRS